MKHKPQVSDRGERTGGDRGRTVALEMTFWRIEPLDALVDFAQRCAGQLEGIVRPPCQCSLKVYPVQIGGRRIFEAHLSLVGLCTQARSVCHRDTDLFAAVERVFAALATGLGREEVPPGAVAGDRSTRGRPQRRWT